MKRFIYTFTLLLAGLFTANSQIVITEIMYNPPESGSDSLEFIEIFNAGTDAVDLTGYTTDGVIDTLEGMLNAGGFLVLAVDSGVIARNFGLTTGVRQWISGGLRNGGELVALKDQNGTIVDSVEYSDRDDWPTEPDGDGFSLELCDVSKDNNLGENWKSSTTETAIVIDGITVFASPGMANMVDCDAVEPPKVYPAYEISEVIGQNADGVADSIGTLAMLEGIVYGINLRPGDYDFTIINDDNSAGIKVFTFDEPFQYDVTEGDRVQIKGTIAQFRGVTQIAPDSLTVLSSGNALSDPALVEMAIGETEESRLIEVQGLLIDSLDSGSSFNIYCSKDGVSYVVRVDSDTEIANDLFEVGQTMNVIGIGGQFSDPNSAPFDNGYQIQPRYEADIAIILSTKTIDEANINIFPNPVTNVLNIESEEQINEIEIFSILGNRVTAFRGSNLNQIDLGNLNQGMYIIRLNTDAGAFAGEFLKL